MRARGLVLALVATLAAAAPAGAQDPVPPLRLAAPSDCLTNADCGPGLARVYRLDVVPVFIPLAVADAGISALDDGVAEVAVAFSTDPQVSRPDIRTLDDDRGLTGEDRIVPVVRTELLRAFGRRGARRLRARIDVSRLITTLQLRALNQQVADGCLPEAVGGEFVDANGLGATRARRPGPPIVLGHQDFTEAATLAHLYAAALRADGNRVTVRNVRGLRPEAVRALRRGDITLYIAHARSLLQYMEPDERITGGVRAPLRRALQRLGVRPLRFAPGENRNLFVTKKATAAAFGLARVSDLARYWPAS